MLNLDTHILVAALADELTPREQILVMNESLAVSDIVLWELSKLVQLGRLQLDMDSVAFRRSLRYLNVIPGAPSFATGDLAGAKLLADSITAERPAHLFGIVLKGRIAEKGLDGASLTTAHRDFLAAYPAEMAAQRPEYPGHQTILDRFLQDARGAKP